MTPLHWFNSRKKHGLSIHSEIILDKIQGGDHLITELIDWSRANQLASLATTHNAIHDLIDKGFARTAEMADKRKKLVYITPKGLKYLGDHYVRTKND